MRDQVVAYLGLQDISSYDETGMVSDLLYQGTIDLLARTRCVVRCLDLRTRAGVQQYTLDHAILSLVDVENGWRQKLRRDQGVWPDGASAVIVDYDYRTGSYAGRDVSYASPGFTLIRSDVLLVKPTPSEDGEIQTWAVVRPQKMQLDTDSPGDENYGAIPDEFQDAIVTYALWKAADYTDDQGSGQGERYRTLYEGQDGRGGRLGQIRSAVNKRGTARAPARRVRIRATSSSSHWVG